VVLVVARQGQIIQAPVLLESQVKVTLEVLLRVHRDIAVAAEVVRVLLD
jgi:hypothetical protein